MKEIVIKLTDHCYKRVVDYKENLPVQILEAIRHGVVLPKGHGALKDADKLNDYFWDNRSRLFHVSDCRFAIDKADTIIEADKEK